MSQLWQSGLNPGLHPEVEKLNRSLDQDHRLWKEDIQGSKAHTTMLLKSGLVSVENAEAITKALNEIEAQIAQGILQPLPTDEDVHSWIERELISRVGMTGSNVHIARSRNEQILLDMKLFLRNTLTEIIQNLNQSLSSLQSLESQSAQIIMPSYTHLRRAQPIYLKEYWEAHRIYWEESRDSFQYLLDKLNEESPMGAGAIHGTTLPTDPALEAELLGFKRSPKNSLSTISSRKSILDFLSSCSHFFLDLSRMMEDLIIFSTDEFSFFSFTSDVTTGSSMMPQKRNPDLCELIRGKSAGVIGHYVGMMTLLKGLPMGYSKDFQEDKTHLFAVADDTLSVLKTLPVLLKSIRFHQDKMNTACQDPSLLATDVMETLVAKNIPLREAHHQVANWIRDQVDITTIDTSLNIKTSCEIRYQNIQKGNS